jgi:hypothetical protein
VLAADPARRVFLADAVGALISFGLLFFLLRPNPAWFGMPDDVVLALALVAVALAAYSSACVLQRAPLRPFLTALIVANILYCTATVVAVVLHREQLTPLGLAYFVAELLVIAALLAAELRTARADRRQNGQMSGT